MGYHLTSNDSIEKIILLFEDDNYRPNAGNMKNPFDTPERVAFRKTLRDFVAKEIKPNADTWDEADEIPWDLHQRVGALGVWGFGIEEQYGGLGMDDCFMRAAYNEEFAMCGANGVPAALNGRMTSDFFVIGARTDGDGLAGISLFL